jgi:hypothetical protein
MPRDFYQTILRFQCPFYAIPRFNPGWLTTQTPPHHEFLDNMGRTGKTKLLKHQATAIVYKPYLDMFFCPTTGVPTKKPASTRPKTRATRRKCLRECSNKLRRKFDAYSPVNRGVSTPQWLASLRCSAVKYVLELECMNNPNSGISDDLRS